MSEPPGGAVAAGSPVTVEAGLMALRLGGNAVDAAVAAQLTACVAEPLLTGLGGGGLATFSIGDEVGVCDFFSDFPGRGAPLRPMTELVLDFGPTTQTFHAGPASAAVPGLPRGIWALHQRFGRLPMDQLVRPAVVASELGVEVLAGFERVCELLWPILELSEGSRRMLSGPEGRRLRRGDLFRCPELGETLRRFASEGPELFHSGELGVALLATLGGEANIDASDLQAQVPIFRDPLEVPYGDGVVYAPPPPSQGGPLVLRSLQALAAAGEMPRECSAEHVRRVAEAMDVAERSRPQPWAEALFEEGFVPRYLGAGHTTHISAVDGQGDAVAITSSLGETCGRVVPGAGLLPNNFLGEADVNPPAHPRPPRARMMTMCCPTLVRTPHHIFAMGSGGSSRIRSSVLHGVVYLVDNRLTPAQAVVAPRCHMEGGVLRVELIDRPSHDVEQIRASFNEVVEFDYRGMYFGGLHVAGWGPEGFTGAGDPRRSGAFGWVG